MNDMKRETPRKVWITAGLDDAVRELEVEFMPDTAISDLSAALAEELAPGVEANWVLWSHRLDRELAPGDPILGSGLVSGDRVDLSSEARAEITPAAGGAVDLVMVGGPLLGTRYRLELGRHIVGRGSGSDVTIDDPTMSRRHLDVSVGADGITVSDAGSTNGTFIDGEKLESTRSIGPNDVIEAGGSLIGFEPAHSLTAASAAEGVEIPFNRPPRVRPAPRTLAIELPTPPEEPTRPRIPMAVSIVPLVIGIALVLLFPENKAMLLFFAMTPVIAVWSFVEERRSGTKSFRAKRDEYVAEVGSTEERIASFIEEDLHVRRDGFPDAAELTERVRDLSPRLWERRPADPDFLSIRVGFGDVPSNIEITAPSTGSRQLREETNERLGRFASLHAVPIVVSLGEAGITGFCGEPADVEALARWTIVQLATLHSPDELELAAIFPSEASSRWDWLKWVPHLGALSHRGRIASENEALSLVERLAPSSGPHARAASTHTLVAIDEDTEVPRSALGRLLRATGPDLSVLWLGRDPRELPGECRVVVEVDTAADILRVLYPEQGRRAEHHGPEGISVDHAQAIAHALAPVRDTGLGPHTRSVPTRIGLWDALEISEPTRSQIRERWRSTGAGRSIRLGTTGGTPLDVDLRSDGPHALIGGTTGAGKSELLRSMVAAVAYEHPPDRVNLFLIDYKGGTAFEGLTALPHVVGCVTDLDRHLSQRTLVSLEAELKRREIVLREQGARDVLELESKGKAILPDLLIVIDEFATLVTELPQFVDGMVDIAQRGRALGLHLILATQKPAGVVSEKIRANTNLRVALRMSDEADSMDVIGLPDAAHIPRAIPGRGFVRMGHGEVTEFQSPYASAPALTGPTEKLVLRMFGPTGAPVEAINEDPGASTQLEGLVDAIVRAGAGFQQQSSPVLPALPNVLSLKELAPPTGPGRFPIGLMDEPAAQRQQSFELDFDNDGSVLVYGAGGSGKTTLLRTIAASVAMHSTPERIHIYTLDLGTRGLSVLTSLPHCGSVIFADEEERIRRLFGMLRDEIDLRRSASPSAEMPTLIVLLDGYAGFAAAFERVEFGEMVDALPRLIADGRQVGIHFVITADRRGAVPAALTGIIANRIVLRLADDDEYAAFGLSSGPDREALSTRGRAFLGTGIVMQCAVPGKGASVTEQIEVIRDLGASIETSSAPPPVRTLPDQLDTTALPVPADRGTIPVGLDERFDTVACDLTDSHMLIAGPRRSGRSTALATIAFQVSRTQRPPPLHLLMPRAGDFGAAASLTTVTTGLEACEAWIRTSRETLAEQGGIVLIDDGDELFDVLSADALQSTIRWARDNDVRFVIAAESHAAHRAFGGWIAELKKEKHGLLLDPEVDVDGDLLSARLPRRKASFPPGRGYFVSRGDCRLTQIARPIPSRDSAEEPDPAPQP